MTVDLTTEETEFLVNNLLNPDQAATLGHGYDQRIAIANVLRFMLPPQFDQQQVGYLQWFLQDQSEIHGRQSTTANEKQSINPGARFRPQRTLILLKSISDKLGASLLIDRDQRSDQHSPNESGSRGIMTPQGPGI